jgi:hypothetical protein
MKGDWFTGNAPTDPTLRATLAHQVILARNTYPNPMRLVAGQGGGADEKFWADSIQGWAPRQTAVRWQHGSAGQDYAMTRMARIPYLVRSTRGRPTQFLDHVLVGYSEAMGTLSGGTAWGSAGGNVAFLDNLGEFFVEDLWPGATNTSRAAAGWDQPSGLQTEGYEPVNGRPTRAWIFRDREYWPDASLRITLTSSSNERRYLLVGYEGGGGW